MRENSRPFPLRVQRVCVKCPTPTSANVQQAPVSGEFAVTTTSPLTSVVPKLKATLTLTKSDKDIQAVLAAKDEVLAQYQHTFAPDHLHDLTKEEFRGFLLFDNNKHWTGLAPIPFN